MRQHIYETWTLIMDSDRNPQMLSDVAKRLDGYNGRRNNGEHD